MKFTRGTTIFVVMLLLTAAAFAQNRSDVILQGFYWNSLPGGVWYDSLSRLAPRLASAGFGAIWFPSPVKGAAGALSMGYDPYDHYDFGDYNQKGSVETRFGSRAELQAAIRAFHNVGVQVYADAVLNHMSGGEAKIPYTCKPYPSFPDSAWLQFQYPNGSGRFKKDASFFFPNSVTCDVNPPYHGADDPLFAFGEWLAKDQPKVRDSLIAWGHFLKQTLGFDGFRLDAVKAVDPVFMGAWLQAVNGNNYAVAEYYGDLNSIKYWHNQTQNVRGGKTQMFDFPLRFTLKDMCNNTGGTFNMNTLDGAGLINGGMSGFDVCTWVENHDVDRIGWDGAIDNGHDPILTNKDLAYAYIMFSEGRPSVFFKDYVGYGFAGKIDTLIWIRHNYLGGGTTKRGGLNAWYIRQDGNTDQGLLSGDIYVARRDGYENQQGGYLVINDHPSQWIDIWVDTEKPIGTKYRDFTGHDVDKVVVGPGGGGTKNRVKLWCPPRTYTIYVADTTRSIGNAPVLMPVPDQVGYTNSAFSYKLQYSDANNQQVTFSLTGNPAWLSVSASGMLQGTPAMGDTGVTNVVVKITDPGSLFAVDTFSVRIYKNLSPRFTAIRDTVIKATKRFELQASASDPDMDTLVYSFNAAPAFLNIGAANGLMSGTPALADTGIYPVRLLVTDRKGAFDSLMFQLTVKKITDSVILTFGKPVLDGTVNVGQNDWLAKWQIAADSDTDSYWNPRDTMNNEILGVFSTWDADSLYIGCHYVINDLYNTMMIYVDAGIPGGVTNFNSNMGYNGDYAKNFRFRPADAVDFFIADYHRDLPTMFKISGNTTINMTDSINRQRGPGGYDMETAIAWNDIYGLGAGKIPAGVTLKMVALVAGGFNYGAGDSAPDNVDVNGNAGPDSLINLAIISPDVDANGFPDPTVIVGTDKPAAATIPADFALYQNYPNPFNPSTVIGYQLPKAGMVNITVYDMLGRQIQTLVKEYKDAGSHTVTFNAAALSSGVYFYQLESNGYRATKKLTLLK